MVKIPVEVGGEVRAKLRESPGQTGDRQNLSPRGVNGLHQSAVRHLLPASGPLPEALIGSQRNDGPVSNDGDAVNLRAVGYFLPAAVGPFHEGAIGRRDPHERSVREADDGLYALGAGHTGPRIRRFQGLALP